MFTNVFQEMTSANRSRGGGWALAGLLGMALIQKAKLHIKKAVQELELEMKGELELVTK